MTGKGYNLYQRTDGEARIRNSLLLSNRHRQWGNECPAVDLDFVLAEYNHGITVAVVDYKHCRENVGASNERSHRALCDLYDKHGRQHPFFVARYWPDTWAFKVKAMNERAFDVLSVTEWAPFSEQQYVRMLYRLRKEALSKGDELTIRQLNDIRPPREEEVA